MTDATSCSPEYSEAERPRKRHRVALAVVIVVLALLAVVAAYGAKLYGSAERLLGTGQTVENAVASLERAVDEQSAPAALEAYGALCEGVAELQSGLAGWEWDVARELPVYGQDVDTARSLLQIVDRLLTEGADPVVDVVQKVAALPDGLEGLAQGAALLDEAADAVANASAEVDRARVAVDLLPSFKIEQLGAYVGQLETLLDQLDAALAEIEPYVGAYESIKGLIEGIGA